MRLNMGLNLQNRELNIGQNIINDMPDIFFEKLSVQLWVSMVFLKNKLLKYFCNENPSIESWNCISKNLECSLVEFKNLYESVLDTSVYLVNNSESAYSNNHAGPRIKDHMNILSKHSAAQIYILELLENKIKKEDIEATVEKVHETLSWDKELSN